MTDTPPLPEPPRPPRRSSALRVLLFVSLLLNLLVIGVVGGALLKFTRDDDRPWLVARELGLGPYLLALDPEQRRALDAAARGRRGELRDGRTEWRRSVAETLAALREDTFDATAFRAAAARQSELAAESREIGLDVMVGQLESMTLEERRAFADRLEGRARFFEKRGEPDGRHRGPPPPPPSGGN